jgi:hypothetical protein
VHDLLDVACDDHDDVRNASSGKATGKATSKAALGGAPVVALRDVRTVARGEEEDEAASSKGRSEASRRGVGDVLHLDAACDAGGGGGGGGGAGSGAGGLGKVGGEDVARAVLATLHTQGGMSRSEGGGGGDGGEEVARVVLTALHKQLQRVARHPRLFVMQVCVSVCVIKASGAASKASKARARFTRFSAGACSCQQPKKNKRAQHVRAAADVITPPIEHSKCTRASC